MLIKNHMQKKFSKRVVFKLRSLGYWKIMHKKQCNSKFMHVVFLSILKVKYIYN